MSKPAIIAGLLILVILVSFGFLFFLSFGVKTDPPSRDRIDDLESAVEIEWRSNGAILIDAESDSDFYAALGYAHGMDQPWMSLLLRQAALGELGAWFGTSAWPEDRLTKTLELARYAKTGFDALPTEQQYLLSRYSDGMNAALDSRRTGRKAPLVLLEIDPPAWKPWHSIAVERLWAWLNTPVQLMADSIQSATWFFEADRALRSRLHLFGSNDNLALVVGGGQQMRHLFRYVTGDSGQSVYKLISRSLTDEPVLTGLSLPGSIIFPAGRRRDISWSLLLNVDLSISTDTTRSDRPFSSDYYRLTDVTNLEEVVEVRKLDDILVLEFREETDSLVTTLTWPGTEQFTDTSVWTALLRGEYRGFNLFEDDGIVTISEVGSQITGAPSTSFKHPNGVLLATNSEFGSAHVSRLRQIISGETETQSDWDLLHDTFSTSAEKWTDGFMEALDSILSRSVREDEALDYLRNWDLSYRGSSIAASIAEYAREHLETAGVDTLDPDIALAALGQVVIDLTRKFGTDMREWRWETIQELSLYFPGWKAEFSYSDRRIRQFHGEFQPVPVTGFGHPSTLSWGPTVGSHWRKASASWEGLFSTNVSGPFEIERPIVNYASFLGRYLAENHAMLAFDVDGLDDKGSHTSIERTR